MAFFDKDPQLILKESLDFMADKTVINSYGPGSKFRTLLEIMKSHLSDAYTQFNYNVIIGFISGANGIYLDYLGDIFGLKRRKATSSFKSVDTETVKFYVSSQTFGDINGAASIVIPAGTKVWAISSGEQVLYSIPIETTLTSNLDTEYVEVVAVSPGVDSNLPIGALKYHGFTNYTDSINNTLLLTNTDALDSGVDQESDENFRYRIINHSQASAAGNDTSIRLSVLGIPGIADVSIIKDGFGIGATGVLVKTTTPTASAYMISRVQIAVDAVKSAGTKVYVQAPDYLDINAIITLNFKQGVTTDEKNSIRVSVITLVSDYINNLDVGDPLILQQLLQEVLSASDNIISIGTSSVPFDQLYMDKPIGIYSVKRQITDDHYPTAIQKFIVSNTNNITVS